MAVYEDFDFEDDGIRRDWDDVLTIERQPSLRIGTRLACALGISDIAIRFCFSAFGYAKGVDTSWAKDVAFYAVSAISGAVGLSMAGTSAETIRELGQAMATNKFIDGYTDILEDPGLR